MSKNTATSLTWNAAIYVRLSKEDGEDKESNSIKNQKDLIMDYVKSFSDIKVYDTYSDDGFSGFSFERPNFKRMMKDAENGLINCIVVKDLSRFGRNWTETGKYLDKILPSLEVRFIAINNHVDTVREMTGSERIVIPFTNLMNEAYVRDISDKTISHLSSKCKDGQFIGAFAPYGYRKHILNHSKLVIDDEAAKVVKDIFAMKIDGYSAQYIADSLNSLGILSPIEYKHANNHHHATPFKTNTLSKWTAVTVTRILKNEIYAGVLEQCKTKKINFKLDQRIEKKKSDWIRVENSHEPIINEHTYSLVNEVMQMELRRSPIRNSMFPFSGLLYCADCNNKMVRKTVTSKGQKYFYYVCSEHKKHNCCSMHSINESRLENIVLAAVNSHISYVGKLEKILAAIDTAPLRQMDINRLDKSIADCTEAIEKLEKRLLRLDGDLELELINPEEYEQYKISFMQKIAKNQRDISLLCAEKEKSLKDNSADESWIELFKQYGEIKKLDHATAVNLIERINVHEKSKIEICFKYQYDFDNALNYLNEMARGC
ncbi:recombinase family protein [Tyzzerella sp. OttesenSCG-928-J15]|nr:recombinase family protein [Tyzzerella sp. OttesenSCG-928-J15]